MKARLLFLQPRFFAFALLQLIAISAGAANFTTSVSQGSGLNWNGTIWQPGAVAPTAGNTYECIPTATLFGSGQGNVRIRNPALAGVQTFVGDSLTMNTNTEIRAKYLNATTPMILNFPGVGGNPGLILRGGALNAGDTAVFEFQGRIHVAATSLIAPGDNGAGAIVNGRGIRFNGILTGTNGLIVIQAPTNVASMEVTSANNNSFTGSWTVKAGFLKGSAVGSLGRGDIIIDPNATVPAGFINPSTVLAAGPALFEVTYDISAGKLTLANGGKMMLHQNCTFTAANISGTELAPGTYTFAQLSSAYPSHFVPGGSGSILVQPPAPPLAPTNVAVINQDSQVTVSWSAAANTGGYNVKRSSVSGGPYSTIGSTASTSFVDSGLVNGASYYYVVSATNNVGESPNSTEIVGAPNLDVEGIVAVGGTNQVSLSWNALAIAENYTVKRAIASGGPFVTIASQVTDTSYVDNAVQSGRTYYYIVVAPLVGGGESGRPAEVSAVTAPGVPSLAASLWGYNAAKLTWGAVDPVVTGFAIERTDDGINFSEIAAVDGAVRTYVAGGLLADKVYSFRIRALNASGSSAYSTLAGVRTPTSGISVNFGSATNNSAAEPVAPVPEGYVQDVGLPFGDRGNGFNYGWNRDITLDGRYRRNAASPDLRYDTFIHLNKAEPPAIWEIEVPNGYYAVHIVAGDPNNDNSVFQMNVEGVVTPAFAASPSARFAEWTTTCIVADGKLTITSGPLSKTLAANNKIAFVDIYAAVAIPVLVDQQPQPVTALENRPLTLSVTTSNAYALDTPFSGSGPLSYQWYLNDNPLAAGTNQTYTVPFAQASDAGSYYVIITNYAGSITSEVTVATVNLDNDPPQVLTVGSVDGRTVGVCFDELVDPVTATDQFNYDFGAVNMSILGISMRPDGKSATLVLDPASPGVPLPDNFTLNVNGVLDLTLRAENASGSTAVGKSAGLNSRDIGAPQRAGSNYSCDGEVLQIIGGGRDVWDADDQFYFASKTISGDFDSKVRVLSLSGSNTIVKGLLMLRESDASNSRELHLSVNPPPPGRDQGEAGMRVSTGTTTTVAWHTNSFVPAGVPDSWLRLARAGNVFTGYRSSNGLDWIQFAKTTNSFPMTASLGLGVTAHDVGLLATGQFSNFSVSQPVSDLAIAQTATARVLQGSNVTYSITVNNNGPDNSNLTMVSDPVPAGATYVSASASQGACSLNAGVITCNLGTLNSGASATVTITVTATALGDLVNTASISGNSVDSNTANNSAIGTTLVYTRPTIGVGTIVYSSTTGNFGLGVNTVSGITYILEFKNALEDATWTEADRKIGTGAAVSLTDPTANVPMRFYRVRLE